MLDKILNQLISSGALSHVYSHRAERWKFSVAKMIDQSDEWILMVLLGQDGSYDGMRYVRKSSIQKFRTDTRYTATLLTRSAESIPTELVVDQCPSSLNELLDMCKEMDTLVFVSLPKTVLTGRVKEHGVDFLEIEDINPDLMTLDGITSMRLDQIEYIHFDSPDLARLSQLIL